MAATYNGQIQYGYYGPQANYHNPAYGPPGPAGAPYSTWGDATSAGRTPMPRPKHLRGSQVPEGVTLHPSNTAMPTPHPHPGSSRPSSSSNPSRPLKSAMRKKPSPPENGPFVTGHPVSEHRHDAGSRPSSRPPSRQGVIQGAPEYMFLKFRGNNEYCLENVLEQDTINSQREEVLPIWPHGVSEGTWGSQHGNWSARFVGQPWKCAGSDGNHARRLICRIFYSIQKQGYRFLTCINPGLPSPLYVFTADPYLDTRPSRNEFFTATVSRGGRRLRFVDPPPEFGETLGLSLRNALPRRISIDRALEDGEYIIEMSGRRIPLDQAETNAFTSHVFKIMADFGYGVMTAVPLSRGGPLGLGDKKELWIVRRVHGRHRRESDSARRESDVGRRESMRTRLD